MEKCQRNSHYTGKSTLLRDQRTGQGDTRSDGAMDCQWELQYHNGGRYPFGVTEFVLQSHPGPAVQIQCTWSDGVGQRRIAHTRFREGLLPGPHSCILGVEELYCHQEKKTPLVLVTRSNSGSADNRNRCITIIVVMVDGGLVVVVGCYRDVVVGVVSVSLLISWRGWWYPCSFPPPTFVLPNSSTSQYWEGSVLSI